ncbi:MAG: YicC family protein [Bacteroidetes bacterium]|nr:YicC family protein [Bacteroidota bacterium]
MLYSMTGYGRAEKTIGDNVFIVEIKSLNGKQFDLRMLTPSILKPYEIEIRNLINEGLERGSVECLFTIKYNGAAKPVAVNTELLKAYYTSVKQVANELNANDENLLSAILRLPDVVTNTTNLLTDDDWVAFQKLVKEAIENLNKHRLNEGVSLEADLLKRVANIELHEIEIKKHEPNRRIRIKENLQKLINENVSAENIDANRLEQELIYYIEKIDISEEQVRLANHINYFKEILNGKEKSKGKKLSFVLQEFGREINTTGSKANDADIQKLVVLMKDEMEKMKEQVLNVL